MSKTNAETLAAISSLESKFAATMSSFEARLQSTTPSPSLNLDQLSKEFAAFKDFMLQAVELLRAQVTVITNKLDEMDNKGRIKFLCIHGMEETQNENLISLASEVIINKLKITGFNANQLKTCFRLGKSLPNNTRPRPILVKFKDIVLRSQIWSNKSLLKGTGITLTEFLTPRRREVFLEARRRHGINRCWSQDGNVFLKLPNSERIQLVSLQQLDDLGLVDEHVEDKLPKTQNTVNKAAARNTRVRPGK